MRARNRGGNVFEWIQKGKESVEEKNTFEKKEEMEIDQEEMEVKTLEKHETLEWMERS